MAISQPREPVYYYECSAGRFRLVYFMPPEMLKPLTGDGTMSKQVLEDYPDGIDLGCTEPDFADFEANYGHRPPIAPEALQRAFFAILSTTHDWKTFRGSGFIPAADLESHVESVEKELEKEEALPEAEVVATALPLRERRVRFGRRAARRRRTDRVLEKMPVRGIDAKRTLRQQAFRSIEMKPGRSAEEVFTALHHGRRPR